MKAARTERKAFPLEWLAVGWTAGMCAFRAFGMRFLFLPAFAALLLGIACFRKIRKELRFGISMLLCGALTGAAVFQNYQAQTVKPLLAQDGATSVCTGKITAVSRRDSDAAVYTLRTTVSGKRTTVEWYAGSDVPLLRIGDSLTLSATWEKIAEDPLDPAAQYAAGEGRILRMAKAEPLEVHRKKFSLLRTMQAYRDRITKMIQARLAPEPAGMLCAMLFGDKSGMSYDEKNALYRTGIGHITAVSGLHLVFFCTLISLLLNALRCSARTRFWGMLCAEIGFILLVDPAVSVFRAALMLLVSQSASLFGRKGDPLRGLCIAVLLCTAFAPYIIGSASFWLSVSGVIGIGIAAPYLTGSLQSGMLRHFASLCCVSAAVFPASILFTGETSLLAPLCNLLILPLSIAALYIGMLTLLTGGLTAFLLPLAGILCRIVSRLAEAVASLPYAALSVHSSSLRLTITAAACLMLILLALEVSPKKIATAGIGITLLLTGQIATEGMLERQRCKIALIGDGTEAALVISSEDTNIVLDLSDDGKTSYAVREYLHSAGIREISSLTLSGGRSAASYQADLSGISVGEVWLGAGSAWRENATVCGCIPHFAVPDSLHCGEAEIRLAENTVQILCAGKLVTAAASPIKSPLAADAVIRFCEEQKREDFCELALYPAKNAAESEEGCFCGAGLLLEIHQSGKMQVRRAA